MHSPISAARRIRRAALVLGLSMLAFVLAVGGSFVWQVATTPKAFAITRVNRALTPVVAGQPVWFLAMGDDRRIEGGSAVGCGCADAIHVIGLHQGGGQGVMLNIPRDTIWTNGRRVNEVLRSGADQAALTIGQRLGIGIHYVAVTNFDGLRGFIDAIGGVVVGVERAVNDPNVGINLPRGYVQMDGRTALAYARSRKAFPTSDIERTHNQANVLLGVFRKMRDLPVSELWKYTPYLTANNMSIGELNQLIGLVRSIDPWQVKSQNLYTYVSGSSLRISSTSTALLNDIRPDAILNGSYNAFGLNGASVPPPLPPDGQVVTPPAPAPAPPPAPAPAPPPSGLPTTLLRIGSRGDAVRQVQQFLSTYGYNPGPIDGIYGRMTSGAVARFQTEARGVGWYPYSVDGVWGPKTAAAAAQKIAGGAPAPAPAPGPAPAPSPAPPTGDLPTNLRPGTRGEAVKVMQQFLTTYGYAPGPIDGIYGPMTAGAVRRFQADARGRGWYPYAVDGWWGPKTAAAAAQRVAAG